jgi:hypothetical protein
MLLSQPPRQPASWLIFDVRQKQTNQTMTIDEFRTEIVEALNSRSYSKLLDLLNDTNPGHYGAEDAEFGSDISAVWVDIPKRSFTFKNADFSFKARLGSSREEDGADMDFTVQISGSGTFDFDSKKQLIVTAISTDHQIDLFPPEEEN